MVVDGHSIAKRLLTRCRENIAHLPSAPRLTLFSCKPSGVTKRYLSRKQEGAVAVGIEQNLIEIPANSSTNKIITQIDAAAQECDGLVVQLPLPDMFDIDTVCAAIPRAVDVDALRPDAVQSGYFRSPVAEAAALILQEYEVPTSNAKAVVVGAGRLVGKPVAVFLEQAGAQVQVVTEETIDSEAVLRQADIIVLGAGVPGLLRPEMVKSGVVIIDAATSEQSGKISGDADPACAEKARVFTPVPGGVGPITVATLLNNVYQAAQRARMKGVC